VLPARGASAQRPNYGKIGLRILDNLTIADGSVLNDLLVLFGSVGLDSIRPEYVYDVVSSGERVSF
jgi:hypothetical protein